MSYYNYSDSEYRRDRCMRTTKALCFLVAVGVIIAVSVVAQLSRCVKDAHGDLSKEIQCSKDGDKVATFDLTVAFLIIGVLGFFAIILVLAACDMIGILCLPCYGCYVSFDYVRKKRRERVWLNETGVTAARTTRVAQRSGNSKKPGLWSRFKDRTKSWNPLNMLRRLRSRNGRSQASRLEAGWPSDLTLPPYTPSTCGIPAPPYEVAVAQTQPVLPPPRPQAVTMYEPTCMELPPTLRTPMLTVPSPTHPSPTRTSHRASSLYGSDIFSASNSSLSSAGVGYAI